MVRGKGLRILAGSGGKNKVDTKPQTVSVTLSLTYVEVRLTNQCHVTKPMFHVH